MILPFGGSLCLTYQSAEGIPLWFVLQELALLDGGLAQGVHTQDDVCSSLHSSFSFRFISRQGAGRTPSRLLILRFLLR